MNHSETYDMAAALYAGGWRSNDKEQMQTEYDLTDEEASAICEDLEYMAHKDFEAYVALMDDEIRESVHADIAPCTDEEFLTEYQRRHIAKYGAELTI